MFYHHEEDTHLATVPEAIAEWAINCDAPSDRAWILSDYDVWVRNPRYAGPAVPHPEEAEYDYAAAEEAEDCGPVSETSYEVVGFTKGYAFTALATEADEDIPF